MAGIPDIPFFNRRGDTQGQPGGGGGDPRVPMSGGKILLIIVAVVAVVLVARSVMAKGSGGGGSAEEVPENILTTWELDCKHNYGTAKGKTDAHLKVDLKRDEMDGGAFGSKPSKVSRTQLLLNGVPQEPTSKDGAVLAYDFPFGKYDEVILTSAATDAGDCPTIHFSTSNSTDLDEEILPFDAEDTMKLNGGTKREVGLIANAVPIRMYVDWGRPEQGYFVDQRDVSTVTLAVQSGTRKAEIELPFNDVNRHTEFSLPLLDGTIGWNDRIDWDNIKWGDNSWIPSVEDLDALDINIEAPGWATTARPVAGRASGNYLTINAVMDKVKTPPADATASTPAATDTNSAATNQSATPTANAPAQQTTTPVDTTAQQTNSPTNMATQQTAPVAGTAV